MARRYARRPKTKGVGATPSRRNRSVQTIRKTKKGFFQGIYHSPKSPYRIKFKSKFELSVCMWLDANSDVVRYLYERIRIPYYIPYQGRRIKKMYFPDFIITFADGHLEMWEIKPSFQSNWYINRLKWQYASAWCKKNNVTFRILTEQVFKSMTSR